MYRIGELCREFGLSRSTLLYYDSIGLLQPSARTESKYRMYSQADKERLSQICVYREAGVSLDYIKELLDSMENKEETILKKRLNQLHEEISLLRLQQKIIVNMLKDKNIGTKPFLLNENTFVSILTSSGVKEEALDHLHAEFEKHSPEEHQLFLEYLGLNKEDIKYIRNEAQKLLSS